METVDDPARAAYERLLAAYAVGTEEALSSVVSPEVTYTIHGDARLSGRYHGIVGMLTWMQTARDLSAGTVRFVPETIAGETTPGATAALVIGRVTAQRGGTSYETGHIYHLRWVDGLLVEGHTYPTDQRAFDELWS